MARDEYRNAIHAVRPAHGAGSTRLVEHPCDVLVGPRLPAGDLQQLAPDLPFERRAWIDQRDCELAPPAREVLVQLCSQLRQVIAVARDDRHREAGANAIELRFEHPAIAELQQADASSRRSGHHWA